MTSIETENGVVDVEIVKHRLFDRRIKVTVKDGDLEENGLDYETARKLGTLLVGLTDEWAEQGKQHR